MEHIETALLNCYGIQEAEQNMVFAARLTQHGHTIQNMADLMDLYHQSYSQKTVENIAGLPHPTVQKFMVITVAVVGASRRFLAQITRHQNEVKYMSASLQYSNYSGHAAFAIPYGIMKADKEIKDIYRKSCQSDLDYYAELCALGIDHDSAGYVFPRSSMATKGLVCELPPIDSGYRGEIHAIISNVSTSSQTIHKDTRVGQLVITPVVIADFVLDLGEERGTGAFGSTGE